MVCLMVVVAQANFYGKRVSEDGGLRNLIHNMKPTVERGVPAEFILRKIKNLIQDWENSMGEIEN
jgi:hypothetical protein